MRVPRRDRRLTLVALLLAALPSVPATADVIVLRNGHEIQGEVILEDATTVTVRFPGGTLRLERRRIAEIRRQSSLVFLCEAADKAAKRGDFELAVELLERARKENPDALRPQEDIVHVHTLWASHLESRRRYTEALAVYDRLLREAPDDASIGKEREEVASRRDAAEREIALVRSKHASGDPVEAIQVLERYWSSYPESREMLRDDLAYAWFRRANAASARADWPDAAESYWTAAVLAPERVSSIRAPFVRSILEQVQALVDASEFSKLETLARRGLEVDAANPALTFFLALSHEGRGEEASAREHYLSLLGETAPREAPISELRAAAEASIFARHEASDALHAQQSEDVLPGDFRVIETEHFRIHHRSTRLAREVATLLEREYRGLFRRLGCQTHWRNRCDVYIHPDHDSYLASVDVDAWSSGAHRVSRRYGEFSQQRIDTWQQQERLTTGVLQHEVAHALLAHRLNYPPAIPLWANEGFAVAQEPEYIREHYRRLVALERERQGLPSLAEVIEATSYPESADTQLFYALSHAVVEHLLANGGERTFTAFLKDLAAESVPIDDALRKHYRIRSVAALEHRWEGALGRR